MFKKSILACLVLALASSAHAQSSLIPINKQAILPPVEFDKPYTGKMTLVRTKSQSEIKVLCRIYDPVVLGCSFPHGDSCLVYIASDEDIKKAGWNYDYVYRHERGHCLSWPRNHPGARYHD